MNIAVRLEGGLGDHLLSNRFVAAIKEKYPEAQIHALSDTENNPRQMKAVAELFPRFYNSWEVVTHRKNKEHKIKSQFGEEVYPAALENLPEEYQAKIAAADKFYDLHVDGLSWLKHDYDWLRYFYHFPKPSGLVPNTIGNGKYILCHLYSRPNSPYNLEKWYVMNFIKKLSKSIHVVIITSEEDSKYYQEVFSENVTISTPSQICQIFALARDCEAFIGIDSGVRYIPYHFSKPTFVFSKYCSAYGTVAHSHLIRWLLFKDNVFPMHYDINAVCKVLLGTLENPALALYPYLEQVDLQIVDRKRI